VKHNFVVSYTFQLPVERFVSRGKTAGPKAGLSRGSPHFSSGFPVTLVNNGDNSLLGAEPNGINNFGIDEPDVAPGRLNLNSNPRNGNSYFQYRAI
jgi:hypothetical protein